MIHNIQLPDGRERLPTTAEALAQLDSERRGRIQAKIAAENRERERRESQPQAPINGAALALEKLGQSPNFSRSMRKRLKEMAVHEAKTIETNRIEAERREAIDNDESVKIARENSEYLIRAAQLTGEETLIADANECAAIAQEGYDTRMYWQRCADTERRISEHHDAKTAEKMAARNVSNADFATAVGLATEARARFDHAAKQAAECEAAE